MHRIAPPLSSIPDSISGNEAKAAEVTNDRGNGRDIFGRECLGMMQVPGLVVNRLAGDAGLNLLHGGKR